MFWDASGGSISWPARNRGKNRAKGVPPLRFSHARGKQCKIERSTADSVRGLGPTGSALAAVDAHPVSFPRSGGASQGATVGTPCRSCPKRGGDQPIAAHEVKRRPQMICRAYDGVQSLVTRAGFLRAEPLGVSFVQPFLHEQKRAGRRRQKLPYKLQFIPRFLLGSAADGSESRSAPLCRIRPDRSTRP